MVIVSPFFDPEADAVSEENDPSEGLDNGPSDCFTGFVGYDEQASRSYTIKCYKS